MENRRLLEENASMASANDRLKVALEEKAHDADMARANVAQLTRMLEERSQDNESVQRERVQNIAGEIV